MQPFSISQPLTPLARGQDCASTIVVNNMADTPLLIKIRTSNKLVEVAPVLFVIMPNCRERVELLAHKAEEAELQFSAIFVDAGETILNEVDSGLLNGFFERMTPQAQRDQLFVEQVLALHFEDHIIIQPGNDNYEAKLVALRQDVAKLQSELERHETSELSKDNQLQMLKARVEMKNEKRRELELEVREKSRFKKIFGVEYKHIWSLVLLFVGVVSGIAVQNYRKKH